VTHSFSQVDVLSSANGAEHTGFQTTHLPPAPQGFLYTAA